MRALSPDETGHEKRDAADNAKRPVEESASSGGADPVGRMLHYLEETGGLWLMKL
jgi:hypothetical protein